MISPVDTDIILALVTDARRGAERALDLLEKDRAGGGNMGYLARCQVAATIKRLIEAEVAVRRAARAVPV